MIVNKIAFTLALSMICAIGLAGCDKSARIQYSEAEKMWLDERYESAASRLLMIVEEYPQSKVASQALFRLGEIHYLNFDQPKKALEYFYRAANNNGSLELNVRAYSYIGEIYENSLGNYDQAILQYQKIINQYPGRVDEDKYLYSIANAYFHKGDYTQARIEYQSLIAKFPLSEFKMDALYQSANSMFIEGSSKKALLLFQRIQAKYPENKYDYDIRLGIATCHEELSELSKALSEYQDMLIKYPDKPILKRKIDSINKRVNKKLSG